MSKPCSLITFYAWMFIFCPKSPTLMPAVNGHTMLLP